LGNVADFTKFRPKKPVGGLVVRTPANLPIAVFFAILPENRVSAMVLTRY
jgi:hypothetical protein